MVTARRTAITTAALFAAAALVACSFDGTPPSSSADAAVGADAPGTADATPGADADLDSDNDGVNDDVDNCVDDPNPKQYNEDGDAFGDICDTCPHLNVAQTDTDGDGVGDACDPEEGVQNTWLFFHGFNEPLAAGDWDGEENWSVSGGQLTAANDGFYGLLYTAVSQPDTVLSGAKFSFGNQSTSAAGRLRLGAVIARANSAFDGDFCWPLIDRNNANNDGYSVITNAGDGLFTVLDAQAQVLDAQSYEIEIVVISGGIGCSFSADGGAPSTLVAGSGSQAGGASLGLLSSRTETTIDYFYAIDVSDGS